MLLEAGCGNLADFGECLLFGVEPPFWPNACSPLERAFRFPTSTFLIGCSSHKQLLKSSQHGIFQSAPLQWMRVWCEMIAKVRRRDGLASAINLKDFMKSPALI